MSIKQKILEALDGTLDDLSEDQLLDILLDTYRKNKIRIGELEQREFDARLKYRTAEETLLEEIQRLHNDPFACAAGEYWFKEESDLFIVRVAGKHIESFRRRISDDPEIHYLDYALQQVPKQ